MAGLPNSFRYSNTSYRRQQLEIYRLSQPKSGSGAMLEGHYDEEYVSNILAEQADLNLKNRQLFADKLNAAKPLPKERRNTQRRKLSTKQTNHKRIEDSRTKSTLTKPNRTK